MVFNLSVEGVNQYFFSPVQLFNDTQPLVQEMKISTLKTEASRAIKMVPLAILNTLVDSIFQFVDQPMLPLQVYQF